MELHTKMGRVTGTPEEMRALLQDQEEPTEQATPQENTAQQERTEADEQGINQEKYVKSRNPKNTYYDWDAVYDDLSLLIKEAQSNRQSSLKGVLQAAGINPSGSTVDKIARLIEKHPDIRRKAHTILLPGQKKSDVVTFSTKKTSSEQSSNSSKKTPALKDREEEIIEFVKNNSGVNLGDICDELGVTYHGGNNKVIKNILKQAPGVFKEGWEYKHIDNTRTSVEEDIKQQKYEKNKKRMEWVHSRAKYLVDQDPKLDYAKALSRAHSDWHDKNNKTTKKDELQAIIDLKEQEKEVGDDFPDLYPLAEESYPPLQGLLKQKMAEKTSKITYFDIRQTTQQMFGDWDGNAWLSFIENFLKSQEEILDYFNATGRFKHEKQGKYDVIRWIKTKKKE